MNRAGRLCTQCVALTAAVGCAVWTGNAYAQTAVAEVSAEFWLGLIFSVLFAMIAGYAKGIEKRVSALEFDVKQNATALSLLRESLPDRYYSKQESRELQAARDLHTAEHRERMESGLRDLTDRIAQMNGRLDHISRPAHRRGDE